MENKLEKSIRGERKLLEVLKSELAEIGGGTLNKRIRGGRYYFMERVDGRQKGITREQGKIYRLARKEYLTKKIEACEEAVQNVEQALARIKKAASTKMETSVVEKFDMLDSKRIIYSDEQLKWLENRQSKNPYMREYLKFDTNEGVLMRSKSERYIGNFIESKELIYMYEPQIIIWGKPVYPDFMILCPCGRVFQQDNGKNI